MMNPYSVLDIPENTSKEEIKKAYRAKAKQYHPDLHPNDPIAAEKMNEGKRQIIGVWDLCVKYAKIVTENCS